VDFQTVSARGTVAKSTQRGKTAGRGGWRPGRATAQRA
jgi:hypothetical protein